MLIWGERDGEEAVCVVVNHIDQPQAQHHVNWELAVRGGHVDCRVGGVVFRGILWCGEGVDQDGCEVVEICGDVLFCFVLIVLFFVQVLLLGDIVLFLGLLLFLLITTWLNTVWLWLWLSFSHGCGTLWWVWSGVSSQVVIKGD